jgi:hypothetical protein
MSALPPKADMCGALGHACFGPIADSYTAAKVFLFDYLVGDGEHARRNCKAERLGGREIEDQVKFGELYT